MIAPKIADASSRSAGSFDDLAAVLGESATGRLLPLSQIRPVTAGTVVLPEGEEADEVGFVLEGMLGMIKSLPDGRRHLIGLLAKSDAFGRIFDGPTSYRLEALTDARLITVPRKDLEAILRDEPEVERRLFVRLLDEIETAREWVLLISGTRVIERVAAYLLVLLRRADRGASGGPIEIHQPLSRRDLAQFLGTRRESISRALRRLERDGAIRILGPDRFVVADIRRLLRYAGQDLVLEAGNRRVTE